MISALEGLKLALKKVSHDHHEGKTIPSFNTLPLKSLRAAAETHTCILECLNRATEP